MRWRLSLDELDFDVAYRKGFQQTKPDTPSRLPSDGHTKEHEGLDIPCINLAGKPEGVAAE